MYTDVTHKIGSSMHVVSTFYPLLQSHMACRPCHPHSATGELNSQLLDAFPLVDRAPGRQYAISIAWALFVTTSRNVWLGRVHWYVTRRLWRRFVSTSTSRRPVILHIPADHHRHRGPWDAAPDVKSKIGRFSTALSKRTGSFRKNTRSRCGVRTSLAEEVAG